MSDKNFLIIDGNKSYEMLEEELKEKVVGFLRDTFGEVVLRKISVEVYSYIEEDPIWTDMLDIKIEFNEYTYFNKVHGECVETIWMTLEDKGLKPFYVDGRFVTLQVFEWIQGMPIQKTEMIYGIHKDKIYEDVNNYILTC